ncbi:MAG: DUF4190 domain-containing protein [Planctomycetota bacterium]|jgi:hypothetical protein
MRPHRGTAILVLGILGIPVCFICGIIAWVMANSDLRDMQAGQMDPSGMGMTKAGKICGIIGVILAIVTLAIWLIGIVLFGLFAGAAATGA